MKRALFVNRKVYERGTFSVKNGYKRVRGCTLGVASSVQDFVEYAPGTTDVGTGN